jgi:alkyldihydroxyacetonephosphate synthase
MPPSAKAGLVDALAQALDRTRISSAACDRTAYARDLWPRGLIGVAHGDAAPQPPDVVVWPETTAEVAAIVKVAAARGVPVVAFGAGSGVTGGTWPTRGGIVLDLKRMNRFVELDGDALTAAFEAGIVGEHLEHELQRRGFTMGHFPSSIFCSTLGGWLAARSAGQASTRYGKIEDMVQGLEVVTGTGEVVRTGTSTVGPDWNQIFVGSEGTLGVITAATVRVARAPEVQLMRGWEFSHLAAGLEAIRRLLQRGLRPAFVRLYDELDTFIAHLGTSGPWRGRTGRRAPGPDGPLDELRRTALSLAIPHVGPLARLALGLFDRVSPSGCLLVLGYEGDGALCAAEEQIGNTELLHAGGRDLGPAPGLRWLEHRYDISYQQSHVFHDGAFVDTMEVATTWDHLLEMYEAVKRAVSRHAMVMAHFSHAYPEGCSIYFTFVGGSPARREAERIYDACWHDGLHAALNASGTLSHHHGVGLSKAGFMQEHHGELMTMLRGLKRVLDPAGIMNPGKLGLP